MSDDPYATWDAAYVLGALSSGERAEYERHLAECERCRSDVEGLAGLPGILGRLDEDTAVGIAGRSAPAAPVADLVPRLARRAVRRRRLRRAVAATGVAAALVIGFGVAAFVQHPPTGRSIALEPVGGASVTAQLSAASTSWGTRLAWSCEYGVTGRTYDGDAYALVVTTRDGHEHRVASWTAAGRAASDLAASTGIPVTAMRSIAIDTTDGTPVAQASV